MSDETYDPNDHTVDEVNKHLKTADDTERERVVQLEHEGQARVGIVGHGELHDDDAEADTDDGVVIVQRPGTVNQAAADKDAERRNQELTDAGVISEQGYIGSAAADLPTKRY